LNVQVFSEYGLHTLLIAPTPDGGMTSAQGIELARTIEYGVVVPSVRMVTASYAAASPTLGAAPAPTSATGDHPPPANRWYTRAIWSPHCQNRSTAPHAPLTTNVGFVGT